MSRKPRILLPNTPLHVVQRGHNGSPVFLDDQDRHVYLQWLNWAIDENECDVHAYTLMSNHVHLLLTPLRVERLAHVFMSIGRRYVQYFNEKYDRSGTLWGGRYYASPILCEVQLMRCYRYIELNPVRAGMVALPGAYRWSSYLHNAEGKSDALIVPHVSYNRLGLTDRQRHAAYRSLCNEPLSRKEISAIRYAWRHGRTLEQE